MNSDIRDYLMQEANLLGERIKWYLEQHEHLEALGLLSCGGVWAFILSLKWSPAIHYLAWIPAVISAVLFIKSIIFTKTLSEAFQYLHELEDYFQLPKGKGWVHYFRARSNRYKRRWRVFFWILLMAANVAAAYYLPFRDILLAADKAGKP